MKMDETRDTDWRTCPHLSWIRDPDYHCCDEEEPIDVAGLISENERLRSLLTEVLGHFTLPGHPGRPCLRTHWISVKKVEKWWELARGEHKRVPVPEQDST